MKVEIKNLKPSRVAYIRHIGPYQECVTAWKELSGWAKSKGIYLSSTFWIGASYDDPADTPPEKLRYDACVVVDDSIEEDETVKIQILTGGRYASAVHEGPYNNMIQTFTAMFTKGLPEAGLKWRESPCLEIYMNDCESVPEDQLKTELLIPVE